MGKKELNSIKLEDFFYTLPGHVYLKNINGVYLACNDLQAKDIGLASHKDIIGKTDYDLFPIGLAETLRKNDQNVINSGVAQFIEEPSILEDGTEINYLSQKVPLQDSDGDIVGLLGITFDLTNIRQREQKYLSDKRSIELTLESILNNMPEHVYWVDKNNIILGCNKKQAETFGFNLPHEIIGKSVHDFEKESDAEHIVNINSEIIRTGKSLSVEEPFLTSEGEQKIFLSKKVPLYNENQDIIGLLGISFDITAEKEAERLRIEKKAAEERAETIKLLSAAMAHELRTPLRAIESGASGVTNYLSRLIETYDMAKAAGLDVPYMSPVHYKSLTKVFDNIQVESQAALSVIDMLLIKSNLAQIDIDKFVNCSIADCVDQALLRYPFRHEERKYIHWRRDDFHFHGDEILMIHVIFNLIKNALHYVKSANKGDIEIWCDKNEQFNILYFKDTGQGIEAEVLPHIFERFYTRTKHGTGVGLAFCQLVMQSMGGDIVCDSVKGEYTQFTLYFRKIS